MAETMIDIAVGVMALTVTICVLYTLVIIVKSMFWED